MARYRRKKRKKSDKRKTEYTISLTKTQRTLLYLAADQTIVNTDDWSSLTVSSLIKRGLLTLDDSKVVISQEGLNWVRVTKSKERTRRKLESKFDRAWGQYGNPTIRLFADEGVDRSPVMVLGDTRRYDFVFPDYQVAIEVQGMTWVEGGGHSRGSGIKRDIIKKRDGLVAGWETIELISNDLTKKNQRDTVEMVLRVLESRKSFAYIGLLVAADVLTLYQELPVGNMTMTLMGSHGGVIAQIPDTSIWFKPMVERVNNTWLLTDQKPQSWSYSRHFVGSLDRCQGQLERFVSRFPDVL